MFKFSKQVESLCTTFVSVQKVNSSLDMYRDCFIFFKLIWKIENLGIF